MHAASLADYRGHYKCRAALDGLAAKELAENPSPEAEARLNSLLDREDRAIEHGDLDAAFDLNTVFHSELVGLTENAHLIHLARSIAKMTLFYRSALFNKAKTDLNSRAEYIAGLKNSLAEHRKILSAISEGDGEKARGLVERHMLDGVENIAERLAL